MYNLITLKKALVAKMLFYKIQVVLVFVFINYFKLSLL